MLYLSTIDIIIPVFNASVFLRRCIESILCQSYTNFHLLIIDDGSKDDSVDIALSYAHSDPRIEVISKSNEGVSATRNRGLEQSSSEWVMFVDADDYLAPDILTDLIQGIHREIDLCVANYQIQNDSHIKQVVFPKQVIPQKDFGKLYKYYDFQWSSAVWGKLFRREIIEKAKLRFNTRMHHSEDLVFLNGFLMHCRNAFFSGELGYYYILGNASSLTRSFHSFEIENDGTIAVQKATQELMDCLHIEDRESRGKMLQPVIFCQFRALNAIYEMELRRGISRRERLGMIEQVNIEKNKDYIYPIIGWKERILNMILLELHWAWLYDLIRHSHSKLKSK